MIDSNPRFQDSEIRKRRMRHHRVLRQLPGDFVQEILEEGDELTEALRIYSNERRLLLRELNQKLKSENRKQNKSGFDIGEVKERISALLQFPGSSSTKKLVRSVYNHHQQQQEAAAATPGCEDCRKAKRAKMNDEKSSIVSDEEEEDNWWIKKGAKMMMITEPPIPIPISRGRRKTQSLAQLQAARIEGSQGASTSHVCDNKVTCPHHGPGAEGENHKVLDSFRISSSSSSSPVDIVTIGKSLKQLQFVDKRSIAVWLTTTVRELVEDSAVKWKLRSEELNSILFLLDLSLDLVSTVKFLLWLLPKANTTPSFAVQGGGRNLMIVPRNVENSPCEIGEAILVSSLRRYENILLSADLVPEAMTSLMTRASSLISNNNGKISGSAGLVYARYILKKYGNLPSVVEWYNGFKSSCEKRLLSELDRGNNSEYGGIPLGVPAGVENPDDYLRKKISISGTRPSRVGLNMREVVQRNVEEASHYLRKLIGTGTLKISVSDGFQVAQQIVVGLMDCIRQTGGAAQEGDPSLVSSAVSAVINSVGVSMARITDFSGVDSGNIARYVLQIHVNCLCLLKEALGERQSRVFEIALATESSTALLGAFAAASAPGKGSRGHHHHHQLSPESYDSTTDMSNGTGKIVLTRAIKVTAAVSSLVIGAITHGVITLERIVGLLRLKENLDFVQYVRRNKSSSNGSSSGGRSSSSSSIGGGGSKLENPIEVYVHWFRLLVGNCKSVSEGLVSELIGESSVVAVSRLQRMLPLKLVFPPAFSILAFVLWRPFVSVNEDTNRLYKSLTIAIDDAIKHLPFRDVCLRDTKGVYELIVADSTDSEFANVLEANGLDMHLKSVAFAPLRARVFLNSLIDCDSPSSNEEARNRTKLVDKIVSVLDCLQPAKFHWQWVELRLLLNEQALTEKLENHDMSLTDAIRSSCPNSEKPDASENEKNFIQILLTRLLVRPDAVPLFSEVVHLFGRSVEDSMLKQAEWFLAGQDVLFGRKTIRQKLVIVGESKGFPTKPQFWKPWGWCNNSSSDHPIKAVAVAVGKKRKFEITSIEEGEVIEEGSVSGSVSGSGITTERAFVQLVLPCIDQSSDESRSTFVNELVRQFSNIEQQLSSVTNRIKQIGNTVAEVSSNNKASTRKGLRGSSPSLSRRSITSNTTTEIPPPPPPPSPSALRASLSLRLQFLLRLLPVICGEASFRNTRHALASTIVRLLGSRVVYDDSTVESTDSSMADLSSEVLFDRLLFILHGLLSNHQPNWLKPRHESSSSSSSSKDFTNFDRDAAENLQNELARMQLPDTIRWRIQAAMPILLPSLRCSLSCQPQSVPQTAVSLVQGSMISSAVLPNQRNSKTASSQGKLKQVSETDSSNTELVVVDPWTLLEDGTSSSSLNMNGSNSNNSSSDMTNLRATCWLKGAVRVRRTDLTYVGSVDEDS